VIVTGAPVEHLDYARVDYWPWFETLASWTTSHAHNSLFVCWAGQALLKHHYGINKTDLEQKAFGIDRQEIANGTHTLTRGLPMTFSVPVSRRSTIRDDALERQPGLEVLARSVRSGAYIVDDPLHRATCLFNHIEYDAASLHDEYFRDLEAGTSTAPPWDYYRPGVLQAPKVARWRPLAHTLFENWLSMLAEHKQKRTTVAA
jgi:homoserine O-succinyltransferase